MFRTCLIAWPTPSGATAWAAAVGRARTAQARTAGKRRCMQTPTHRKSRSCAYSVQVGGHEVAEVLAGHRLEWAAGERVGGRGGGGRVGAQLPDDLGGRHAGARAGETGAAEAQ